MGPCGVVQRFSQEFGMDKGEIKNDWLQEEMDPQVAMAVLMQDTNSPMAWHRLGLAFALSGRTVELLNLADQANGLFGDSLIFMHNVVKDLALRNSWATILTLAAEIPAKRREHSVALYYAGCADVQAGRNDQALVWFDRFKQSVLPRHADFPLASNEDFNLIFRQGILVESPQVVREIMRSPFPIISGLTFVGDDLRGPFPFVVSHIADTLYFLRFVDELCSGHQAAQLPVPLHFHVIAPNDEALAVMKSLPRRFPGLHLAFSHEPLGAWNHPVYYTIARFMIMNRLLERYHCPVMAIDADILPLLPVSRIFEAAANYDFACFQTGRHEPASVYQASIMIFGVGALTRSFLADLTRFCALKLDLPPVLSWMLDQAALYSVLTQRMEDLSDFRFCSLDRVFKATLQEITRQLSTDEEKLKIMTSAP
jgi:hypothetical protein